MKNRMTKYRGSKNKYIINYLNLILLFKLKLKYFGK